MMRSAKLRSRAGIATALALFLIVALGSGSSAQAPSAPAGNRLREIYVPFEEFQRLISSRPEGVVMSLDEYRTLVADGLTRAGRERTPQEIPPLAAVITHAHYDGRVRGRAAYFTARVELTVLEDGWVTCELGAIAERLGSVQVDGKPGWILRDDPSKAARLLIEGRGRHSLELGFALPVEENERRFRVTGPLVAAPSAALELAVLGEADVIDASGFVKSAPADGGTKFELAVGSASSFQIEYRARRGAGERGVLLLAEHLFAALPRAGQAPFAWWAQIYVERESVDRLALDLPAGLQVTRVEGPLHAWQIAANGDLEVTLAEATQGKIELLIAGIIATAPERFSLEMPLLRGAAFQTGAALVFEPRDEKLRVTAGAGLRELERQEALATDEEISAWNKIVAGTGLPPLHGGTKLRAVAYTGPAQLDWSLSELATSVRARSAFLLRVYERRAFLEGRLSVEVESGRLFALDVQLPPDWRLVRVEEQTRPGANNIGLRAEETAEAGRPGIRVLLDRALAAGASLDFQLTLESNAFDEDRDWRERTIALDLPVVLDAARARTDLGLALHDSLYAGNMNTGGWRALSAEEARELGLTWIESQLRVAAPTTAGVLAPEARVLVALTTDVDRPRFSVDLKQQPARGEYRAATAILASERQSQGASAERVLRVRGDVRVAVVNRGIDVLEFVVPGARTDTNVNIIGKGIKEIKALDDRRTVTFVRPFFGERQFRVEYELVYRPDQPLTIAAVSLAGDFGAERFLVLQSEGSIELELGAGDSWVPMEFDELPDFADPWANARVIRAYRVRARGAAGTVKPLVHERAPLLGQFVRSLKLATVLGASGGSRTHVEFLLAYARDQYVTLELPVGANCIAVTIDGEPVRSVRPVTTTPLGGGVTRGPRVAIPLPPRSFATIALVYERAALNSNGLAAAGVWQEAGPRLESVPVGEVEWVLYSPSEYRLELRGGNLRATSWQQLTPERGFLLGVANAVFRRPARAMMRGSIGTMAGLEPLSQEEQLGAQWNEGAAPGGQSQRLQAQQQDGASADVNAPRVKFHAQGREYRAYKFGGDPVLEVEYQLWRRDRVVTLAVFAVTLVVGLGLARRLARRRYWQVWTVALIGAVLLPSAIGRVENVWSVPVIESLVVLGIGMGIVQLVARRRLHAASRAFGVVFALGVLGIFGPGELARAQSAPTSGFEQPWDGVLIPYDIERLTNPGSAIETKVYIPDDRFQELWKLAHPDGSAPASPLAEKHLLGAALYQLEIRGDQYLLTGSIPLLVLTDDWISVPLTFDRAQLQAVRIDGALAGVSSQSGAASIDWRGRGLHEITVELVGKVVSDPGRQRFSTQLLGASAVRIQGTLPAGAEPRVAECSGVVESAPGQLGTLVRMDLGAAATATLSWHIPRVEGAIALQPASRSLTHLWLGTAGMQVARVETLRVTGNPIEQANYRIAGDWQITSVTGPAVAAWSIQPAAAPGEAARLEVFFASPINESRLEINGFAMFDAAAACPTLELDGAVHQESWFALVSRPGRRFTPESLGGLERVSPAEVPEFLRTDDLRSAERIHHAYDAGASARLGVQEIGGELTVATDGVLLLDAERAQAFVRVRVTSAERAPLRARWKLSDGWRVVLARAEALRSYEVVTVGAERTLVCDFLRRLRAGDELLVTLEAIGDVRTAPLALPDLRALSEDGLKKHEQAQSWVIAASELLEVTAGEAAGRWQVLASESLASWVRLPAEASARFGYRNSSSSDTVTPSVSARSRVGKTSAVVSSFGRFGDEALLVNVRAWYRMSFAGRASFAARLPVGAELLRLECQNLRGYTVTAERTIEWTLQSPAVGDLLVDFSYRVRRGGAAAGAGNEARILPIELLDGALPLAEQDHYVGVVRSNRHEAVDWRPQGLQEVEPESVPYLPGAMSAEGVGPTYRATARDWALVLAEQGMKAEEGLAAVVPLADLTTVIGVDGLTRTRATYTLVNRHLQFFLLEMPAATQLWSVNVDGKPVAVGRKSDASGRLVLQIPVERASEVSLPIEISVYYEEARVALPALRATTKLAAPRPGYSAGVQLVETIWSVHYPEEYSVQDTVGKMRLEPESLKSAKKITSLLQSVEGLQTLLSASNAAPSQRARDRAQKQLEKAEMALGDNIAELEYSNRNDQQLRQEGDIGRERLGNQIAQNLATLEQAQVKHKQLKSQIEQQQAPATTAPVEDADVRTFNDRTRFLRGRDWRTGAHTKSSVAESRATGVPLSVLNDNAPYFGWQALACPPVAPEAELSTAEPVSVPAGGLSTTDELQSGVATLGVELVVPRAGYLANSYHQIQSGDAEARVALSITRQVPASQWSAWAALALMVIGGVVWRVRSAKRARVTL